MLAVSSRSNGSFLSFCLPKKVNTDQHLARIDSVFVYLSLIFIFNIEVFSLLWEVQISCDEGFKVATLGIAGCFIMKGTLFNLGYIDWHGRHSARNLDSALGVLLRLPASCSLAVCFALVRSYWGALLE